MLQFHGDFHTNVLFAVSSKSAKLLQKSGLKIVRIEEKCCKYHVHEMLNLDFSYCVIPEIGGVLLEDGSPQDVSQSFCSAHRLLSL